MCIKVGKDELETVKNLMGMSLRAVVAEALEVDLDDIEESSRLREDLGMDARGAAALTDSVADTFDGVAVEPAELTTFGDLLQQVVLSEFAETGTA